MRITFNTSHKKEQLKFMKKNNMNLMYSILHAKNLFFLGLALFAITSCEKSPGEGGLAIIKGNVLIQNINEKLVPVGTPYVAQDEDVFISYGDSDYYDDDVQTSADGKFQFNYLLPGKYSIAVISDDNTLANENTKLEIVQEVEIKTKDEVVSTETFTVYNYVDFNDGTSCIKGNVVKVNFLNGTAIIDDTVPAQNEDVFLKYQNSSEILERARTSYDGTYIFNNLIPGNYEIFTYSEQLSSNTEEAVGSLITIAQENETKELATFTILNY